MTSYPIKGQTVSLLYNMSKNYQRQVIPTHLKKSVGDIAIASIRLSVRPSVCLSVRPSVMLSPPKPLNEIQPNLVCELLT